MVEKRNLFGYLAAIGISGMLGSAVVSPALADGLDLQVEHPPGQTIHGLGQTKGSNIDNAGLILGRTLVNQDGDKIGRVSSLVRSKDDHQLYAVVRIKEEIGMTKAVAVPYDEIRIMPDEVLVQSGLTADDYTDMPSYRADEYRPALGYLQG